MKKPMSSAMQSRPKSCFTGIMSYGRVILIEKSRFSYGKKGTV
jgi:hypothetical protein